MQAMVSDDSELEVEPPVLEEGQADVSMSESLLLLHGRFWLHELLSSYQLPGVEVCMTAT